ncbi:SRPBCC family protein [Actinospongicola halichondriae]|uniref:SRPBCC family protein n=1 Tax=Actinospongicola halichondriae TaxID=3236844 RepID=UPI003D49D5D4
MQFWTRRTIATDTADAWDLLTDLDRWPEWGPSLTAAELDAPGRFVTGATGRMRTSIGVSLPFELTHVVDGERWSWDVGGVTATSHAIEPSADGVRVSFGVPVWAPPYLAVCAVALRRIETLLTSGRR